MKHTLPLKLDQLTSRLSELNHLLASESATRDMDRYRMLAKEHAEIDPIVSRFRDFMQAELDLAAADEFANDPEMKSLADEERADAEGRLKRIGEELQAMLLPKDPNDDRNVFLEIRAG